MGMYIKVLIAEPCITPKNDWQSIISLFSFLLLIFSSPKLKAHRWACTVYPQYVGIKKPLDGFSHYINIGV